MCTIHSPFKSTEKFLQADVFYEASISVLWGLIVRNNPHLRYESDTWYFKTLVSNVAMFRVLVLILGAGHIALVCRFDAINSPNLKL